MTFAQVWIIAFISFEAMHHKKTSSLQQTLTVDLQPSEPSPSWLELGHSNHKAWPRYRLQVELL